MTVPDHSVLRAPTTNCPHCRRSVAAYALEQADERERIEGGDRLSPLIAPVHGSRVWVAQGARAIGYDVQLVVVADQEIL